MPVEPNNNDVTPAERVLIVEDDPSTRMGLTELVTAWGTTWAISVATYYGLWKPTGVAGAVQAATADVGLGKAA